MDTLSSALNTLRIGDFQTRWEVAKQIPDFGEAAITPLLAILNDPQTDDELLWFALRVLGAFHHPDAILALVAWLDPAQEEDLSFMAAQLLAEMGADVIDQISPFLGDLNRQPLAIKALAQINHPRVVPLLLEAASTCSSASLELILGALDQFQDPAIVPLLRQSLQNSSPGVRKAAIAGLAARKDQSPLDQLVDVIIPFLADGSSEVADQAARALGRLGTDPAAIALIETGCQAHTSSALQPTLIQTLGWIGSLRAITGLIQIWQALAQQTDLPDQLLQEILVSLSRATGALERTEAARGILMLLRSPLLQENIQLQSTAVLALGRLAVPATLGDLIELLAESNYALKLHIIAALKQLAPDQAYPALQRRLMEPDISPRLAAGLAIALREW